MKKRTVFLHSAFIVKYSILICSGVADIQIVAPVGAFLRPYPDIGNIFVTAVPIQPARNIPFQTSAVCSCGDGIVPTVNRRTFKPQSNTNSVSFGIVDPSLNVKFRDGVVSCGCSTFGVSSAGGGVGCCVGAGFGSGVGSTAFGVSGFGVLLGTTVCGDCVPGAGLCSAAGCEFSACTDSVSALIVAVLFTALSLLSETEADERSSGSVRS